MNARSLMVLMLALVCGVSAAVAVSQIRPETVEVASDTTPIVAAAIDIPRGTSITADILKTMDWPKDQMPEGAITSIEEVVGRTAVIPMLQNEPLVERKIDEGLGVASLIGPGMRAFTISTPDMGSKVAGLLLPGNKVDVLWTQTQRVRSGGPNDFTGGASVSTLLQGVQVFAIDQAVEKSSGTTTELSKTKTQSVTLLVTEEQAKKLSLAQSEGTLSLALRRDDDASDTTSPIITLNDLRGVQGGPPIREGLATAASFFRDVIKANQQMMEKQLEAEAKAKAEEEARIAAEQERKEREAAEAAAPKPIEPVWVRIRTLRGRNSGQVNLQLHGRAQVSPLSGQSAVRAGDGNPSAVSMSD
ncbi:Flp pilus assembly protein CpaB [Roseiconus nitratireducens]|uniref:Flp pilus assembly protein CpaB n=1 Tax=Roseiconus nitratireducens TaxID=2605748 RepID=A0A5M6D1F8_9BACT|nr:Flp pilus assembly protein CpaB [Roseiconus nitratireducens]KAA5541337.1 Flp pilus assembly protein CpaB [Roseiconus nitratireducens]